MAYESLQWLKTVETAYGSLESFDDARTVRIMMGMAEKDLAYASGSDGAFEGHPALMAEWAADNASEIEALKGLTSGLTRWLERNSSNAS